MKTTLTRRQFLSRSAGVAGIAVGTYALGRGLVSPTQAWATDIQFAQSSCGPGPDKAPRVLVAYASTYGSTGGVAEAIGKSLCDLGVRADIRLVGNTDDPGSYDAVIVGSAIERSKWLPQAMEFLDKHRKILKERPVAYFLTCLTLYKNTDEARRKAQAFLDPVKDGFPEIRPVSTGFFGGVLDFEKYSFVTRMIMKQKMKEQGVPEGDYRDWGAIRGWAQGVRPILLAPTH